MELEAILISEVTQEQKTKHHMFALISGSYTMRMQGVRMIYWAGAVATPVITALWGAEAGGSQSQEI